MQLTATHVNYFIVCPRKLWLFNNGIRMEHTSDTVYDGKLLHEVSYPQRAERYTEVKLSAEWNGVPLSGKIDFYDPAEKVIHETKRSDKVEEAHSWQVKYYIWLFELNNISGVTGILEYPRLRQTNEVLCSERDRTYLEQLVEKITSQLKDAPCPPKIHKKICKSCSYYDLCYIDDA